MPTIRFALPFLAAIAVLPPAGGTQREAARSPELLDAFLSTHAADLGSRPPAEPVRAELDRLCAQRDCWASRLYWYTDLAAAESAARAEGKLILSLRLLGRLDEELSCANSRFFRTVLYADPRVAEYLRRNFVLHWQSVRAAPKMTVDFGDGRSLVLTVTGNSIHYVLDADGRPLDVLPGLWAPATFLRRLEAARAAGGTAASAPPAESTAAESAAAPLVEVPEGTGLPALRADTLAVSKMLVERPLLGGGKAAISRRLQARAEDYREDARLLAPSLALMRAQNPGLDPGAFTRLVEAFERSIAIDTARNEDEVRPRVLALIEQGGGDLEAINRRVYSEVFLTPDSDPWLGLLAPDVYTGLQDNGARP